MTISQESKLVAFDTNEVVAGARAAADGRVGPTTTHVENATIVRAFGGQTEGVPFSPDLGTDVTAVVQAAEAAVDGGEA